MYSTIIKGLNCRIKELQEGDDGLNNEDVFAGQNTSLFLHYTINVDLLLMCTFLIEIRSAV